MSKEIVISSEDIREKVKELVIKANTRLPRDVFLSIRDAAQKETKNARLVLDILVENAIYARDKGLPICQDTGIDVIFIEIGTNILLEGDLLKSINKGVSLATKKGYLRASVCDPITRKNTGDNTPSVVHLELKKGNELKISVLPKGCGSENMSGLKMLPPSSGINGVIDFVVQRVKEAGPNPCPPGVIGVGIGGTMEMATLLSKKALFRPLGEKNPDEKVARIEDEIFKRINGLGVGPQGLGGNTTTLSVAVETFPCHIASLPVSVNIQCHAARRAVSVFKNGTWQDENLDFSESLKIEREKIDFSGAKRLNFPCNKETLKGLMAGDWVLISGTIFTARDQTHKRILDILKKGETLPFDPKGQLIYYVGPSPAPPGMVIGSAGPTTSYRMDAYTPALLSTGISAVMGKGRRSKEVKNALKKNNAIYLATIGGAGAYLSKTIKKAKMLAFKDLGPEALFELEVKDLPAIVINDTRGNDYYEKVGL